MTMGRKRSSFFFSLLHFLALLFLLHILGCSSRLADGDRTVLVVWFIFKRDKERNWWKKRKRERKKRWRERKKLVTRDKVSFGDRFNLLLFFLNT